MSNMHYRKIFRHANLCFFTIKDPTCARRFTDLLITSPNDSIVAPFSDYPGPMIKEMLDRQFKSLVICEPEFKRREDLKVFKGLFHPSKNIKIYDDDIFNLITYPNEYAEHRCLKIVRDSLNCKDPLNQHDCDKRLKFIVPLVHGTPEQSLVLSIFRQATLKTGFCSLDYSDYYLMMSNRMHGYITAKPASNMNFYRANTILLNTFFKFQTLDSVDLKSAFEIDSHTLRDKLSPKTYSYDTVHFVKCQPKSDILSNWSSEEVSEYKFFVIQIMAKRKTTISSFLDKWFSHYDHILEQCNVYPNSRIGDLSIEQILKMFNQFKSQTSYARSTLRHAAERYDSAHN